MMPNVQIEGLRAFAQSRSNAGLDARRELGKWLNEPTNKDIDRVALAELCANFDEAISVIGRIVSYYDDPRTHNEYRGLPNMETQAKANHEATMFGAARAILMKASNMGIKAGGTLPDQET